MGVGVSKGKRNQIRPGGSNITHYIFALNTQLEMAVKNPPEFSYNTYYVK